MHFKHFVLCVIALGVPSILAAQRPELTEVAITIDGDLIGFVEGREAANCLWMGTYTVHEPDASRSDSVGAVGLSFYAAADLHAPRSRRDGSDASAHTRVVVGSSPHLHHRKALGLEGPWEETGGLSEVGEALLSALGIGTRGHEGEPTIRWFFSDDLERLRSSFPWFDACRSAVSDAGIVAR